MAYMTKMMNLINKGRT